MYNLNGDKKNENTNMVKKFLCETFENSSLLSSNIRREERNARELDDIFFNT